MSLLELLQIVGAILSAAKEAQEIAEKLKGHDPKCPIPKEHELKIRELLNKLPSEADKEWDVNHTNFGG